VRPGRAAGAGRRRELEPGDAVLTGGGQPQARPSHPDGPRPRRGRSRSAGRALRRGSDRRARSALALPRLDRVDGGARPGRAAGQPFGAAGRGGLMATLERTRPAVAEVEGMTLPEQVVLQHEVEQFLYAEAALLDARRFRDWLALLADDIHYWMPI